MKKIFGLFLVALYFLLGMVGTLYAQMPGVAPNQSGSPLYMDKTKATIVSVLKESQARVYDYNEDGLINCIDYACVFKLTWDKKYPDQKSRCALVRNKKGKFHHLFAVVHNCTCDDIEVETWAKNQNIFSMYSNWPEGVYDPNFNIYGETSLWLNTGSEKEFFRRISW